MSAKILIVEDEMLVAVELEATLEVFGGSPVGIAADPADAERVRRGAPENMRIRSMAMSLSNATAGWWLAAAPINASNSI
ncbi:MAG: hypothetical protein LH610_02410 [Sphingomonas bacterium]|nr:hypothetical protein [Sphingomonas bacterium]